MAVSGDQWIGIRRDGSAWGWNGEPMGHACSVQLPQPAPQRLVPGNELGSVHFSGVGTFYLLRRTDPLGRRGQSPGRRAGDGTTLGRSISSRSPWRTGGKR